MSELAFPLLGSMLLVLGVLPACALVAKGVLLMIERRDLHGLDTRYAILVGSTILPLAWFLSAGVHQAESGVAALTCLYEHGEAHCPEPSFFVLVLSLALALLAAPRLAALYVRIPHTAATSRVTQILATHRLSHLDVRMTELEGFAIGTVGLVRPRVIVGTRFARALSDEALASALAHEAVHVDARDPLRYALLRVSLALNPFGALLLEPHAQRFLAAREVHCDREAVLSGAEPTELAQAIVVAARPLASVVSLGAADGKLLRLRVDLLLAFAERRPEHCCRRGGVAHTATLCLFLAALLLPHRVGTTAIDALHTSAEHLVR